MMELIKQQLASSFRPISLSEMDSVKLMNRTDTKYVFKASLLPELLERCKDSYQVLEIKGNRASRYETLYYDTANLDLYHKHQTRRTNRHKIRSRNYVESNLQFLEVKLKNNKGRTIKDRIKIDQIEEQFVNTSAQYHFLKLKTGYDSAQFCPQFWVNYSRITLVNLENQERCTIDLNLQIVNNEQVSDYSYLVILELKQEKAANSPISSLMKEMQIREGGLSKYCLGVISQYPEVKQNNFKKKLKTISKLKQHAVIH